MSTRPTKRELALWRRALETESGRDYWRGVLELAGESGDLGEFPDGADLPPDLRRRDLLKLLGASIALAGLGGCYDQPTDEVMPYVEQPPEATPGVPQLYATTMFLDGFGTGLLARSNDGRPTKVEGNPEHPASLGATGVYEQASVLGLYDPHRLQAVQHQGRPTSWQRFLAEVAAAPDRAPWFVLYPQSSPVIAGLVAQIARVRPDTRVTYHSPVDRSAVYAATRALYGRPLEPQYDFTAAARVLSLDADFAASMPMSVRWARDFSSRRRLSSPSGEMNRLYMVEAALSPTGSLADHRLAVRKNDVAAVGAAVLQALAAQGRRPPGLGDDALATLDDLASPEHAQWAAVVARDLAANAGRSIVIAGDGQPETTHVVAHLLNAALESTGRTVSLTEPALLDPQGGAPLEELAAAIDAEAVSTLIVAEANPVYTAPAELELAERFRRVPRSVHLTLHANETSAACRWLLPAAHYLEGWGDGRAFDGTLSFAQPLIRPLYDGRSTAELLAAFAGEPDATGRALLQRYWLPRVGDNQQAWRQLLQRGFAPGSASPPVTATLDGAAALAVLARAARAPRITELELAFQQSPSVYDGRFANNGWLQELPQPMTKLTWGNAAVMSPRQAAQLGVDSQDVVELQVGDRKVRAPVLVNPGHADGSISLALGYGRAGAEALARGVGVNAYRLRTRSAPHAAPVQVTRTGDRATLAITQEHWRLGGRDDIAPHTTLERYRAQPDFAGHLRGDHPTLLPRVFDYDEGEQWAMTIDTMICTGCSSCVVACQAENNIPIVGKRGVRRSREMHWLRIDRYYVGSVEAPEVINQPMLCQHCEKAPCEYVCPVFATTHSPDGLNEMTYNRCIGTRFCSNNCPYKVRRFNYFEYNEDRGSATLQWNPNVTVRSRGVMEKCTFCVQRIRGAGITARIEKREVRPGEVQTACQQACPTGAIQFGSLRHDQTAMVRWRGEERLYSVLHHLGTRPRVDYLAKISNPNPELA